MDPDDAKSGWRLASGSQMIGKAVALPDAWSPVTTDFDGNPRPAEGADIGAHQLSSGFLDQQSISLHQVWNLISSSVEPHEPGLRDVFDGMLSDVAVVEDETGDRFVPETGTNAIGDWETKEAYRVYVNQAQTLQIEGSRVNPDSASISLQMGWNLVAYLPSDPITVKNALSPVADELVILKNGAADVYIPDYNINEIKRLQPGRGYAIYVSEPATLTYPSVKQQSLMSDN